EDSPGSKTLECTPGGRHQKIGNAIAVDIPQAGGIEAQGFSRHVSRDGSQRFSGLTGEDVDFSPGWCRAGKLPGAGGHVIEAVSIDIARIGWSDTEPVPGGLSGQGEERRTVFAGPDVDAPGARSQRGVGEISGIDVGNAVVVHVAYNRDEHPALGRTGRI